MCYFKTFLYKAVTLCVSSLYSLQIPVSAAEEGKAWLLREKGHGSVSVNSCQSTSSCPHSQHGAILIRAFLPLFHLASQIWHLWGAVREFSPQLVQQCWRWGRTGDWRVTVHWAVVALLLPNESHCSKAASLWAVQPITLTSSFITCTFSFLIFFKSCLSTA